MKRLPKNIFVTGIDTNVGKTIVSACLVEALHADYWKPVQAGNIGDTDTALVKNLVSDPISKTHHEAYSLRTAAVPSHAADIEGISIEQENIMLPATNSPLIVEGAGGLMVHLRRDFMVIDLIKHLSLPVILVSKNYLGSINHTLLSIGALRHREIEILGVVYGGERIVHMRELIYDSTGVPEIGSIDLAKNLDREFISEQALRLRSSLAKHFILP